MPRRWNLTVLAILASATAAASPRSDPTLGRAVFTGATEPGVPSLTLDPAAITQGVATELYVALASTIDQLHIDQRFLSLDGAQTAGPSLHSLQVNPGGTIGFLVHTSDRITLGMSGSAPPWETFIDGRNSIRYQTLGGYQHNYLVTIGGSLKVANELFVGASVSHDVTRMNLHYSRDTALENGHGANGVDSACGGSPCGLGNPQAAENYDVLAASSWFSTDNLRINLGVMGQIVKDVWGALSYHPPPGFSPIQTVLNGQLDVRRAPRDGGDLLHGKSTVYVALPATVDLEVRAKIRSQLELHVGGRWEDTSRFSGYDIRAYGIAFPPAGVPEWTERARGLEDSFAVWAGVEQIETGNEWLRLGGRLGYESQTVPDNKTSPITVAPSSLTLDVGAQLKVTPGLVLQLSYGLQAFERVNVANSAFDPRARIDCIENGFDYSTPACASVRNGYAMESADGMYTHLQHALRVGLRYDFPP